MSELPVPRRMERLLEALGADTEFRDAVIGDLAEEFAIRVVVDGEVAARRWYYREALRVAPYLLRDWWRGLTGRDIGYFARVAVLSSLALQGFEMTTRLGTHGIDPGLRSLWESMSVLGDARALLFGALMVAWTIADGVFGGYVAARLGRRAPLGSALVMAAGWAAFMVVQTVSLESAHAGLMWMVSAMNTVAIAGGIVVGGALGAARRPADDGLVVDRSPGG